MLVRILLFYALIFSSYSSSTEPTPYIINGSNVSQGDIPWQVYISGERYWCGGIIIGERWVLTAAHCLTDKETDQPDNISEISVHSNSIVRNSGNVHKVDKLHIYPGYTNNNKLFGSYYDIALIHTTSELPENSSIKMLPVSQQNDLDLAIINGWVENQARTPNLLVSGWGYKVGESDNSVSNVLQATLLTGVPDSVCSQKWEVNIAKSYVVCATTPNPTISNSACNGDSGGPVIWQDPSAKGDFDKGYRLVGIVSRGKTNCSVSKPAIKTQVSQFYNWVKSKTGALVTDTTTSSFPVDVFQKYASTAQAPSTGGGGGGTLSIFSFLFLCALTRIRRSR